MAQRKTPFAFDDSALSSSRLEGFLLYNTIHLFKARYDCYQEPLVRAQAALTGRSMRSTPDKTTKVVQTIRVPCFYRPQQPACTKNCPAIYHRHGHGRCCRDPIPQWFPLSQSGATKFRWCVVLGPSSPCSSLCIWVGLIMPSGNRA